MKKVKFQVDGKDFFAEMDFVNFTSFEVKSVPRPYRVEWLAQESPSEAINCFMQENNKNLLFIDEKIHGLYAGDLNLDEARVHKAKASEEFKTLKGVMELIEFLERNQFTKGESLIVAGGGIIQDVGAFAGACYKRGIPWTYIPTTLLSMCDSCIGGKTGINHNNAKNQLALFSAPSRVIINPSFLRTLDYREIASGLGEIIKLHATGGNEFIENYSRHIGSALALDYAAFKPLILGALSVKRAVIEEDEFEIHFRRSLNYGHTVGHAVEVLSEYRIPHGQAVAIGMIIINELSNRRSLLSDDENRRVNELSVGLLDEHVLGEMRSISTASLGQLLKKDKKTIGACVNFVVLKAIGDTRFLPLELNSDLVDEIADIIRTGFGT